MIITTNLYKNVMKTKILKRIGNIKVLNTNVFICKVERFSLTVYQFHLRKIKIFKN